MSGAASNQERTIVTKGTAHVAVHTAPDMCLVPGEAAPRPFPNLVKSEKLAAGATKITLIDSQPVWTTAGELGPPSEPAHEGTLGGVQSGTYRAEAKPTSYSRDVFMEGDPVVRVQDRTTQNHGNTTGVVLPEALLAALWGLACLEPECLAAAAAAGVMLVGPDPG
jgi:hypothetical protein